VVKTKHVAHGGTSIVGSKFLVDYNKLKPPVSVMGIKRTDRLCKISNEFHINEMSVKSDDSRIKTKNKFVGGRLIYTFLFLNPNPFRVLDPYIVTN